MMLTREKLQLFASKACYAIVGPTTKHLELEMYLWVASLLLTISSWQALYKEFPPLRLLWIVGIASFRPLLSRWYISHYNPRYLSAGHVMEVTEGGATTPALSSLSNNNNKNYWARYWPQWMPPLPALSTILSISMLLFYTRAFWKLEEKEDTITWNLLATEHRPDSNLPEPAGYYSTERPDWKHVFFYFSFGGIVGSILVFGRILPPLPDFVAGSTVYQTIKSMSHKQTASPSPPVTGPERFRPVTNGDRLELHLKLLLLRLLENIGLCGWLPRTEWMQQFIRQRNTVMDLKYFLFFAGITGPRRKDIPGPESDSFSALWVYCSLVTATLFLLMAQSLLTDRSYLSTLAFWSTEWEPVEPQLPQAPLWDARHKYKPGDVCVSNNRTYQAVLHHPQGPPMQRSKSRWMKWLYQWLPAEVGHGVMHSRVWSELLRVQSILVVTFLLLWCFASTPWSCGLGTALLAHFVVWYGLVHVGATDYHSLQKLAKEVQVNYE